MSYIGTTKIGKMFLGNTEIAKAYLGTDLVFQNSPQIPVEYLQFAQSDLNTGVTVSGTGYKIEIECQVISNYNSTQIIVGVGSGQGQWFGNANVGGTGRYAVGSGTGNYFPSFTSSEKKTFTISYGSGSTTATDGSSTISITRLADPDPIHIGRSGAGNFWAYMKVWYIKIYNGTTLVRDFIPVKRGGVGYFYDRVSGSLFGNVGPNDFVIGE